MTMAAMAARSAQKLVLSVSAQTPPKRSPWNRHERSRDVGTAADRPFAG
jgi:hypothetical protein